MDRFHLSTRIVAMLLFGFVFFSNVHAEKNDDVVNFGDNYQVTWGSDHVSSSNQGDQVQLSLDALSGSGFDSKERYGSGFFNMSIKLPDNLYTAGLVVAFYLTSNSSQSDHDELDFEFLGHAIDEPFVLQTNLFANGQGNREHRMSLWFDPTADFHSYQILWNQHQIVYYIDGIPIRVFKNLTKNGIAYPFKPMQVVASLWVAEGWATGQSKMNYNYGPFNAQFKGFKIDGCTVQDFSNIRDCYSDNNWWNEEKYWRLDPAQQNLLQNVKRKHLYYDYCNDLARYPTGIPQECKI